MTNITFQAILNIYEQEIKKNVHNKRKLYYFERYKMSFIMDVFLMLQRNDYQVSRYHIFLIHEPKLRVVMSLGIKDKLINHVVTRYLLEPRLSKYLDYRNIATRKDLGSSFGIKLIMKY